MPKLIRWARNLVFALLALVAGVAVFVFAASERVLRRQWDVASTAVAVPTDGTAIERGRHVALTRGCLDCHGDQLEGQVFFDEPHVARLIAPNLTKVARERSAAELERAIRHGVNADGRTVRGMPSNIFYQLSDEDLGDLVAFLRASPVVERELPDTEVRLLGRVGLATGKFRLAAELVDAAEPRRAVDAADPLALGRYVAATTCTECHGDDLRGNPEFKVPTPDLAIVAGYTPEQFRDLMRHGRSAWNRPLDLMKRVAVARFAHLTDAEVEALHAYLGSLAAQPVTATAAGG